MIKLMRSIFWPLFWIVISGIGLVVLLNVSPTAREVIGGAALSAFQVVTSPFILESTLVLIGVCIVLGLSQWRQDKEAHDEWVYLKPTSADLTESAPPAEDQESDSQRKF